MLQPIRIHRLAALALTCPLLAANAVGCAYRTEEVSWTRGDVRFAGTLYLPKAEGPHAAIVFISGSGTTTRSKRIYREHATHFASRGTAVLVYDKRGCGESGGDWKTADLEVLAEDLVGGLAMLRERADIDGDRLVLMGLSQGAWVALIAAERSPGVAGIVILSGAPMTPEAQNEYVIEARLRQHGHEDRAVVEALEIERLIANVYRTDEGWEETAERIERVRSKPWFADARLGLQPRDYWNWQWYRRVMDYNPVPALKSLKLPILAVHGEKDVLVPPGRSIEIMEAIAPEASGPRETALIEGAQHDLRAEKGAPWPDAYWRVLDDWLTRHGFAPARPE